jgi:hypothetical protein
VTAHGCLSYKRACYHCAACQHTLAPLDQSLALDSGSTTTQVACGWLCWPGNCPLPKPPRPCRC